MPNNKLCLFILLYTGNAMASSVEWEWQHYTSKATLPTQIQDHVFFKWNQNIDLEKGSFYFKSHSQLEYALDKSRLFYLNFSELYLLYKYSPSDFFLSIRDFEFFVGRKIKPWSVSDKYWELELWNSLSKNSLHPQINGLAGIFFDIKADRWSLDFLVIPLHIPHKGVPSEINEKGQIISRSRWFVLVPHQVSIQNKSLLDIKYTKTFPFIFDFLFQPGTALQFKTWSKVKDAESWLTLSLADKPVNQLFYLLRDEKLYVPGKTEGEESHIDQHTSALPVRQKLAAMEWGVDYKSFSSTMSLAYTQRREIGATPKNWYFFKERASFTYFSALLKYNFRSKHFVQIGYLHTWFHNYPIHKNRPKTPSILQRNKVVNGIGFDGQMKFLSAKGFSRLLTLSYRYSFLNPADWLFIKALYYFNSDFSLGLSFNMLRAKEKGTNYFLNHFRHNDYFSLSLAYEF